MKELALITIHGMGKVKEGYYLDLEEGLKKRLGNEWSRISFKNVQYAPIMQEPQDQFWNDVVSTPDNDLDSTKLRKFFLYGFGDAGSLEYSAHTDTKVYIAVQQEIQNELKKAFFELGEDKSKPVVIIAQSLGCQVISNYLWDAQEGKYIFENTDEINPNELDFIRLKSLRNLVTTGCNIPLFISGLSDRKCFKKPNKKFQWDNYYDSDDVLGWPLKQLGKTFKIINDHDINSGSFLTSWNSFSHVKYWSDNDVLRPLTNVILNHLL